MNKSILILILCPMLFSCGTMHDGDKIGDAQLCLDKIDSTSTAADVNACTAQVDGIESQAADNIRCNGGFIREGFLGSRLKDALDTINAGTGATSVQTLMGLLSFTSANDLPTDTSNSLKNFYYCMKAGGKASTLLGSFSYFTMSLVTYFHAKAVADAQPANCPATQTVSGGYSFYDLSTCGANTGNNDPTALIPLVSSGSADADAITAQSGVGTILIGAYNAACSGSNPNKDLCPLLGNAITAAGGTSNPRAVAVKFFEGTLGLP